MSGAEKNAKAAELESLFADSAPRPPLVSLRGWGQRLEDWLGNENWAAGNHDWGIIRPDVSADNAMMEFSIDFPTVVAEIKAWQEKVEAAWEAALDDPRGAKIDAYADLQDALASRIAKACDLIEARQSAPTPIAAAATVPPKGDPKPKVNADESVRLTPTDEKILAVIDKHGSVDSQTDLLDKMAKDGEIIDIGSIKGRLAELKARRILIAKTANNRGYRRPEIG